MDRQVQNTGQPGHTGQIESKEMAMQRDSGVKNRVWEKIAVQRDFWVKNGILEENGHAKGLLGQK